MAERFETMRGARVHRNPWIMAAAASPLGAVFGSIVAAIVTGTPQALMFLPHLIGLGVALTVVAWRRNPRPRHRFGHLAADERGVVFEGRVLVPREEVRSGFVLPRTGAEPIVRFRRRGLHLPVDVQVPSREDGRAMLRALGLDASQSVAKLLLLSQVHAEPDWMRRLGIAWASVVVAFFVLVPVIANVYLPAAVVATAALVLFAFATVTLTAMPTRLEIGADGLHLRWFRRSRFIGYGDITRVDPYEDTGSGKNKTAGLELTLRSGEKVRLPVMSKRSSVRDEIYIVHERIAQAVDTWSRGEGVAHAALVRRGGRETSQWIRALRGMGVFANADARTAPVMPERLWRIVEDPAAPADARAGAAVALAQASGEEVKSRLRAAASAIAAPKLRFAIETAVTSEGEEALAAALAEVESEENSLQQRG